MRRWSEPVLFVLAFLLSACNAEASGRTVVIYTSVDQVYSEPILKAFEQASGIRVLPVYDVEAAKTTGLVNRLIAEKDRPQADVFWNGEFAQTLLLKQQGILAPYRSASANDIPVPYRDADGYWTGFTGRARVLLVNTRLLGSLPDPQSIFDLLSPKYPAAQVGIAYPMFGTTATHAGALYAALGAEKARAFFEQLHARGVRVVDGNSVVRDLVASGQLMIGLTDTDDACGAIQGGAPVRVIFPDQGKDALGTLLIPNTIALVARAPHSKEGEQLIDFLLSSRVEQELITSGWSQIALRPSARQPDCLPLASAQGMKVGLTEVFEQLQRAQTDMSEIFIR